MRDLVRQIVNKYFWLLSFISFSLLSILSYGFIKDLYFWHEDYVYINSFYTEWYHHAFYTGELIVLYLFFLLFGDQPMGYFLSALVIYMLLSFTVAFFAYFFSKSRKVAFISGLFFASGYIGSENMQMVEIGITHTLYLILSMFTLIIFAMSRIRDSMRLWFFSFILFILSIFLVPVRGHTLIVLLFLTEIYLILNSSKKPYFLLSRNIAGRLSLFILSFYLFYKFVIKAGSGLTSDKFTIKAGLNLLSDFGNFLLPSEYLVSLFGIASNTTTIPIASIVGFILLLALAIVVFCFRKDKKFRTLFFFLVFSWIATYILIFWRETGYSHSSWFRYLFFPYPFYVILLALCITRLFSQSKSKKIKYLGLFCMILVVVSNLVFGYISPTRKFRLERSLYVQKFVSDLKTFVPLIEGKSLFYFDVEYDPFTLNLFSTFLQGGRARYETSLAFFYHLPTDDVKLAMTYDDFISEYKKDIYKNAYVFFYSKDYILTDLSKQMTSSSTNIHTVEISSSKISQINENNINVGLSIDPSSFPSYRPVQLDIEVQFDSIEVNNYPYPVEVSGISDLMKNQNKRKELLNYIVEKNEFKKIAQVKTSESLDRNYTEEFSTDNDLETSWIANKPIFFASGAWLEITFPDYQEISEIRWRSSYKTRFPTNYDYQVPGDKEGTWKTILSVRDQKVDIEKYIVDKIPKTQTRVLRMKIYKTSSDSPAITEIEALKHSYELSSNDVDNFLSYPLSGIQNQNEASDILNVLKKYQKVKVYPLTDKFVNKSQTHPIYVPITIDEGINKYSLTLPASGTNFKKIIVEFPLIPLSVKVKSAVLTLFPL